MKYKKIVKWGKEPRIQDIIGGFTFSIVSLFLVVFLLIEYTETIISVCSTLMFCFGIRLIYKGWGKERKVNYRRIR